MAATLIAGASAAATSVAIPTHQVGDLLVVCAYRGSTATVPTVPTAGGTVPTWGAIDSASGSSNAIITRAAVATATNHTTGTWTNANEIAVLVIRGQDTTWLGGHAVSAGSGGSSGGANIASASTTLTDSTGSSLLLYFWGIRSASSWGSAPAGQTRATTSDRLVCNTKDDSTSDGSLNQGVTTPTSQSYRSAIIEVLAPPSNVDLDRAVSETVTLTDATGQTTARARNASDSATLADVAAFTPGFARTASDGVTLADAAARSALAFSRAAADGTVLADVAVVSALQASVAVSEAITLGDVASADVGGDLTRPVSETLALADAATVTVTLGRTATDELGLADVAATDDGSDVGAGTRAALSFYGR